jgi:hypothetical protein
VGWKLSIESRKAISEKMKDHGYRKYRTGLPPVLNECVKVGCTNVVKFYKRKYCSNKCSNSDRPSNRTALENYRRLCSFNFNIFEYPDEFDLLLIEKHGLYSPTNKNNNL